MTPRENPDVNGPWICNKGRDLANIFERPRAEQAMQKGKPAPLGDAIAAARRLIREANRPAALVSSWGSNEELAAFKAALGDRVDPADHHPRHHHSPHRWVVERRRVHPARTDQAPQLALGCAIVLGADDRAQQRHVDGVATPALCIEQ